MNIKNDVIQINSENKANINKKKEEDKNEKKKLIRIGECSRFYLYILASAFFRFLCFLLLGYKEKNIGLFGFCPIINSYNVTKSIYTYIGYIIFGTIFYYAFKRKNKKRERETHGLSIKLLIHNKSKLMPKSAKTIFQIILVCFFYALYNEIQNILYNQGFQFFYYWTFETIFSYVLMKKYFVMDIYTHHKCSIIFIVITCSIFLLIASFLPGSTITENERSLNSYQIIEKLFNSYYYCIFIILFLLFLSFIISFSRTYSKIIMQTKYLSKYSLIIFIGITGLILSIIASIILYYTNKGNHIMQYFSELKNCPKDLYFYLEIFLVYPIFIFFRFLQINFEILVIYYLDPIYALMINNLYDTLSNIVLFILSNFMNYGNFIFSELSEVFALIGYTIYLEILELNFCGLSENVRRNIKSKADKDYKQINDNRVESYISINETEEDEESDNESKYEEMTESKTKGKSTH